MTQNKPTAALLSSEPTVNIDDKNKWVERGGYRVPIYACNTSHYFQDSVHVDHVERDEDSQPRPYNQAQGEKIAESVRRKVLMQPILCRWSPEQNKFLVTEGQHRWRAFKDILVPEGYSPYLPAIIYVDMAKRLALQCGLEANAGDRAHGLAGGDYARKAATIMEETRAQVAADKQRTADDVSEEEIFAYLGKRKKSEQKAYLLGDLVKSFFDDPESKIRPYLGDKSSKSQPVTVKNFEFFLARLAYLQPLSKEEDNLREAQYDNIRKLTDLFVENVLGSNWTPDNEATREHTHARNLVRRHPFEALGYFMGKILDKHGGNDLTVGAAWAKHSDIDWKGVEKDLKNLLASHVWDEPQTYTCRNIDELKKIFNSVIEI